MTKIRSLTSAALALLAMSPLLARAQSKDSAGTKVVTPQLDFSGVIFGSYSYRTDSAAKAGLGGKNPNSFNLDRIYLTFRMPVGDHASIRATTDIFQQTNSANNSFYQGWVVRVKYGYLQYVLDNLGDVKGMSLTGRVGLLHNVVIDHEEAFWPRYLAQTAIERNGFFSSSDLGAAGLLTLPNKFGEIYGTIVNGPGYTASETDRFKDFALRVSLTPFATSDAMDGYFKTFAISPWVYKGWLGSKYQSSTFNTATCVDCPVTDGLKRDRWGIFAGNRDRRLTFGAEYARAMGETEVGSNSVTSPRTVAESQSEVMDAFVIARPLEWADAKQKSSFGIVGRIDQYRPNTKSTSITTNTSSAYNRYIIAGLFWEPTSKTTLALDYQWLSPQSSSTTPEAKTIFLHWQASF